MPEWEHATSLQLLSPLAQDAKQMLEQTILPFWCALRDKKHGGYYGWMSFSHQVNPHAEKGCILNSRILWFFSEAARLLQRDDLKQHAQHAYHFLCHSCWDATHGGMYWSVTYDGKPLDTTKHTYNQAFAIYALSAYYRLTGDTEALDRAKQLFHLIEERCTDAIGYQEAFTVDWQPASNEKLSENGVMAAKTMNTLLHVFEGYAGLFQAEPFPAIEQAMRRILDIYANRIYDPTLRRQRVFFDATYTSIIDLHSYGHDIESSWLMDWGCDLLADAEQSASIHAINDQLAAHIYEVAYTNHSLANECDRGTVDTNRVWWVQAEAVVGFIHAWHKHPDQTRYRDAAIDIYQFIREKIVDPRPGGEWYWLVDANGVPNPHKPLVEPWKCPYHNGRMCMELIRRNPLCQI